MAAGNPFSNFTGQCVGWVRNVLPWVPGGPANAYQYANGALANVGASKVSADQAQVGDVVVWPAGLGGSDSSSGHIAVVSGILSSGGVQVSQANWGERGELSTMTIPTSTLNTLDVYAPPPDQQPVSAARARISAIGLPSVGQLAGSTGPSSPGVVLASDTSPGAGAPDPQRKLWYGTAFLPDGPYIHTLWKMAFTAGGLFLIWSGFRMFKGETPISLPKVIPV